MTIGEQLRRLDERARKGATVAHVASAIFLPMTRAARATGYALGSHGSGRRDIDLIAVPWIAESRPAEELLEALRASIDAARAPLISGEKRWGTLRAWHIGPDNTILPPELKPHGRRAWNIITSAGVMLDVSVLPLLPGSSEAAHNAVTDKARRSANGFCRPGR